MPKRSSRSSGRVGFVEPMECLPVKAVPDGPQWSYEILCGRPHNAERF
jgi:hypothetical protein